MTFGEAIATARERAGLSQSELATWIIREDGRPISADYLDDLERDRRRPPSRFLVEQFGAVLDIPHGLLVRLAGMALLDNAQVVGPEQQCFGAA
jgi:transcriptional regulator with XRE-family HTH domain